MKGAQKLKNRKKDFFEVKNITENSADLYFYGDIVSSTWSCWEEEDQCPENIRNFLSDNKNKDLNIFVNSGGGSVFAGIAIYNMLKRHTGKKTVKVDGLAASIASVIALAGDEVIIPATAMFMIHKPMQMQYGYYNSTELLKIASDLDEIEKVILNVYQENIKENINIEEIKNMVNNETWLTGEEAAKYFNINVVEESSDMIAACQSDLFNKFRNTPELFKNQVQDPGLGQDPKNEKIQDQEERKNKLLLELNLYGF